jgi:hypothetical protein
MTIDVAIDSVPQPQSPRATVVITEVVDARTFGPTNPDRSQPQLITGGEHDPSVTARSLGQFTTAGGAPFWDFLLPANRTVADLVREALESAFHEAGIAVVHSPEDGAIPITAEIIHFWSWNTGSWTFKFHFLADVNIMGQLSPFEAGETVQGTVMLQSAVAGSARGYVNTNTKGIQNFVENVRERIRDAEGSDFDLE